MRGLRWIYCLIALLIFIQGCRGCGTKEEEPEITITLQTEKPTETTVAPEVKTPPAPKPSPRRAVAKAPEKHEAPPAQGPSFPQVQPAPQTDEAMIRQIIDRQKQAFETKNSALFLADLAATTDKEAGMARQFFDRYKDIHVDFTIEGINIQPDKAQVTMIQDTKLTPKGSGELQERYRVLWGFVKKGGAWKISETKRLEELK